MSEQDELVHTCRSGLHQLDLALEGKIAPPRDPADEATRCMTRVRDMLIDRRRSGDLRGSAVLSRINQLMSELVSAEFPLAGFRRNRLKQAREHYAGVIAELESLCLVKRENPKA